MLMSLPFLYSRRRACDLFLETLGGEGEGREEKWEREGEIGGGRGRGSGGRNGSRGGRIEREWRME